MTLDAQHAGLTGLIDLVVEAMVRQLTNQSAEPAREAPAAGSTATGSKDISTCRPYISSRAD